MNKVRSRITIVREEASFISLSWFSCRSSILIELEFRDVGFCGGRKTGKLGEKLLVQGENQQGFNNKLNLHRAQARNRAQIGMAISRPSWDFGNWERSKQGGIALKMRPARAYTFSPSRLRLKTNSWKYHENQVWKTGELFVRTIIITRICWLHKDLP